MSTNNKKSVSFIVPAYNEEKLIGRTIASIKRSTQSLDRDFEIIVVDNNSNDKTAEIAKQLGAKVIFEPHNQISRARNRGASIAQYQYLIFVDADSIINHGLVKETLANLDSGNCCGGGSLLQFDTEVRKTFQFALNTFHWFAKTFGLAAGCYVYCLKQTFLDTGGFSSKMYAGEEIQFSKEIKKWGKRKNMDFILIRDYPIQTSTRKFENESAVLLAMIMHLFLPFAVFSRRLCWFWYKRTS